jgi:hypothetical protein
MVSPTEGDSPLTICTVSFLSEPYIALNRRLTTVLNPGSSIPWLVIDNSPAGSRALASGPGVTVVRAAEAFDLDHPRAPSQHHAAALNRGLDLVRTRYVLVLDPDFFVVRPHWAGDVLRHMEERGLAFFGAPWHPRWFAKYRYFPCIHCLFIDLDRVPRSEVDFRPGRGGLGGEAAAWTRRAAQILKRVLPFAATRPLQALAARRAVGQSQDTGYLLHRRFAGRPGLKAECAVPVFRPGREYPAGYRRLNRGLDAILPDRLSYVPKQMANYTPRGFAERGMEDVSQHGWEEFVWRDEPFGFHVRRQQMTQSVPDTLDRVEHVVERVAAAVSTRRPVPGAG